MTSYRRSVIRRTRIPAATPGDPVSSNVPIPHRLTRREHELVSLWAQGFSDPEIANRWQRSYFSVRTYAKRVFAKLQVHSRAQAVLLVFAVAAPDSSVTEPGGRRQ